MYSIKPALIAFAPLATIFAVGCATPAPIVRLTPTSPNVVWVSGRMALERERGDVRVAVAFEHQDGRNHAVHVEIENRGEDPIEVGPDDVWFAPCTGPTTAACAASRGVIDPEQVLANLDVRASRERASAKNQQAFDGTLLILSAVGDVAEIASRHPNRSTGATTASIAATMEANAAAHETAKMSIAAQREVWANAALRRSTLFPGQGAGGNVFFPADLSSPFVCLCVRAHGQTFQFWFRQTVTEIDRPRRT